MLIPMFVMAQDPIVQKDNITYTISGNYAKIKNAQNCSGDVVIPTTVTYSINDIPRNATVNGIMERAFSGCVAQSIFIPNTVTSISYDAFQNCRDLASIVIDSENAMYDSRDNCNAIIETSTNTLIAGCKNTIIPNSVTAINKYAFSGCRGLTNIDIPNNVTSIGTFAFYGCTGMKSVVIPSSVTIIGDYAFRDCYLVSKQLTNNSTLPISDTWGITLCDEETNEGLLIKDNVAVKCRYYASDVTIPNSVTSIKNGTFSECSNLTSITIGSSITNINKSMLSGCSALTNISVSPSNTKYDSRNNCNAIVETASNELIVGLNNTIIPSSVISIGESAFYGCSSMTSVTIPNSVTNIGRNAFELCRGLTNVIIPNSVTSIGYAAFVYCSGLTSIIIPSSVTTIGDYAFESCSNLTSVIVNYENPIKITSYTFPTRNNITLYVPRGCKAMFETANYWKEFKEIKEMKDDITISSNGIATYSSTNDLDFTDVAELKAYIASGFSPSTGELTLTRVYKVPAGEGLLLKGDAGDYEIPYATTDMVYSNLLKGVTTPTELSPTDGTYTNFILANGSHGIGFYTLSASGNIAANKAYLQILTSDLTSPAASLTLVFNDEANNETEMTGIDSHKVDQNNNKVYYNLRGQAVSNLTKGIYILNNKKVLIK